MSEDRVVFPDRDGFPERDDRLGRLLAEIEARRERSEVEWGALEADIVAKAELPLARRRRSWLAPVMERARPLAAAAAVALLVLGGVVYVTPRPISSFADVSAELINLLGEEEVRSFFPGADDPNRLLEAALAAR
jgi:hypothetical protein